MLLRSSPLLCAATGGWAGLASWEGPAGTFMDIGSLNWVTNDHINEWSGRLYLLVMAVSSCIHDRRVCRGELIRNMGSEAAVTSCT